MQTGWWSAAYHADNPAQKNDEALVHINAIASWQPSHRRRHQPKTEVPIVINCGPRFLHEGLSYACRHPKPFTITVVQAPGRLSRKPPLDLMAGAKINSRR